MTLTYKRYISVGILLAGLLIAVILQSRSFIAGYSVSIIVWWMIERDLNIKVWQLWCGLIGFVVLLAILTICVKSNSTLGRMLIYKISWDIFKEHYINGIGWGKFQQQYGLYQAAYFKTGKYTTKELLLAGNTYFAFNDYWQLIIELGIKGVLILAVLIVSFGKLIQNLFKNKSVFPFCLQLAVTQVTAIVIAAFFTHIFEKLYIQIIVVCLTAVLIFYRYNGLIKVKYIMLCLVVICLSLSAGVINFYIVNYQRYQQWRYAIDCLRIGYLSNARQQYMSIYPCFKHYPPYLNDYSNFLIETQQYEEAIGIILQLLKQKTTNTYFVNLGDCYFHIHRFKDAELSYTTAVFIVPNRFEPRYALYKFYISTGQINKAIVCANAILALPVKVPSARVIFIQNAVKQALTRRKIY